MLITAVGAHSGEPVVFDRHSRIALVDAVAYARPLILSPLGARTRKRLDWGLHLTAQADELRAHGSRVESIFPDANSLNAIGDNLMDLSTRPPRLAPLMPKAQPAPSSSPNSGSGARHSEC